MEAIFGIPIDIIVAVGVLLLFLLFNYTVGKNRSATMLLAMYIAGAMIMLTPLIDVLGEVVPIHPHILPILEFAVLTLITYVILWRCRFFDPYIVPAGWELGVFAVLHTVLAIAIVVGLEPAAATTAFSPNFARVFLDPLVRSACVAGPMLVFIAFRGRE